LDSAQALPPRRLQSPDVARLPRDATNVVLVGPNGVGKSTLARNIAHHAVIHGHIALFASAGQMLGDLTALDSDSVLRRRLHHYVRSSAWRLGV
jgi:DNA replication protein DnaC